MSGFQQRWLTVWCWAVGLFGVVLAAGAFEATAGPVRALYTVINADAGWPASEAIEFTLAVLGAVMLGWSMTLHAAFRALWRMGADATPIWRQLAAGVTIWFIVDSALSIATGFALNAGSNTLFYVAFLWPLLRSGVLQARGGAADARSVPA